MKQKVSVTHPHPPRTQCSSSCPPPANPLMGFCLRVVSQPGQEAGKKVWGVNPPGAVLSYPQVEVKDKWPRSPHSPDGTNPRQVLHTFPELPSRSEPLPPTVVACL